MDGSQTAALLLICDEGNRRAAAKSDTINQTIKTRFIYQYYANNIRDMYVY